MNLFRHSFFLFALFSTFVFLPAQSQEFLHPSDVVSEMKDRFRSMKSYQANFKMTLKDGKDVSTSSGTAYYKSGGKVNFTFRQPYGDWIISNGEKMWIYVAKLRAVGIQDLQTKNKNGTSIYDTNSYEGLVRLFERYHYRFDTPDQPQSIDGKKYFVFYLNEKTSSGGYESLRLYVSTDTYLIEEIKGYSPSGKEVSLKFSSIEVNPELSDQLFQYKKQDGVKIVENPLTTQ